MIQQQAGVVVGRARGESSSALSTPVHGVVLLGALTFALVAQGGFFGRELTRVEALVAVALVLALVARPLRRGDLTHSSFVAATAVVAATIVTGALGGVPWAALPQAAFIVTLLAVVMVVRRLELPARDALVAALVAAGAVAGMAGWCGVVFRLEPLATRSGDLWRAASVLGYANAAGGLFVVLGLVAIARLADAPSNIAMRLGAFGLLVAAGATMSRGAAVGFAVGLVVLLVVNGARQSLGSAASVLGGAAVAVAGLVPSMLATSPTRPALAIVALVIGASLSSVRVRGAGRWVAAGLLVAACAASVAGGSSLGRAFDLRVGVDDVAATTREHVWHREVHVFRAHPVAGVGPTRFALRYEPLAPGATFDIGRFAHNEYVQLAAEQGLVGLGAFAFAFVVLAIGLVRRRGDGPIPAPLHAGVVAALAAFSVHAGFDFVWNVPAIPLVVAALFGAATRPNLQQDTERSLRS